MRTSMSTDERAARYAEALTLDWHDATCVEGRDCGSRSLHSVSNSWPAVMAKAVDQGALLTVADAEFAALVADRDAHERHAEELSQVVAGLGDELDAAHNRTDEAEAKVRAIEAMHWPEEAHRLKQQRDALRFQVEAVEALADEWISIGAVDVAYHWDKLGEKLRAALYPAQPDWTPERIEALRAVLTGTSSHTVPLAEIDGSLDDAHRRAREGRLMPRQTLTSRDPQPGLGSVVRDIDDREWENTGGEEGSWANWQQTDPTQPDPETWTKVAGNYGPVTLVQPSTLAATSSTLAVAEFVTARLDEDEAAARERGADEHSCSSYHGDPADPFRWLAQCAAMRSIVERATWVLTNPTKVSHNDFCRAKADLYDMADIWKDHPDHVWGGVVHITHEACDAGIALLEEGR